MMKVTAPCKETFITEGIGDIILGGPSGTYLGFASDLVNGDTTPYMAADQANIDLAVDWELGILTYHATSNSVSRTAIRRSTNGNLPVDWGSGTKYIWSMPLDTVEFVPGGRPPDIANLVAALGGDLIVQGIYDARYNVIALDGVSVDKWGDARGDNFGPVLVAAGVTRPMYDVYTQTIRFDGVDDRLVSVSNALYNFGGTTKALAYIGSNPAPGNVANLSAIDAFGIVGNAGLIQAYAGGGLISSTIPTSTTRRLTVISKDIGIVSYIDVPDQARVSANVNASRTEFKVLEIGSLQGTSYTAAVVRVVVILSRAATVSDIDILRTWSLRFHGITVNPGATPIAVVRTPTIDVTHPKYGADRTGVLDSTNAFNLADADACGGALGLDGVTVKAESEVYIPPGRYRHNTDLLYRGAPWRGAGINETFLEYRGSSAGSINAVGTNGARKVLRLSDMTLDGSFATGTAYGLRLGYNMRSPLGLERVRIQWFPLHGMYFAGPCWIMSFAGVQLMYNKGMAIGKDVAVADLNAFNWFDLVAEGNGLVGSGVGGVCDLDAACKNWSFHGGCWEENKGIAEARFTDANVNLFGTYVECDVAGPVDGLVFAGASTASIHGVNIATGAGKTGKAIKVAGTSKVVIDRPWIGGSWPVSLSVEDTAKVVVMSEGYGNTSASVAAGASLVKAGIQGALVANATDAATVITQLNALLARLRAHGLIAT